MSKEELQDRKAVLTERFDKLTQQRQEIEDELKRLQGEYRLAEELLQVELSKFNASNTDEEQPKRLRKVATDAED